MREKSSLKITARKSAGSAINVDRQMFVAETPQKRGVTLVLPNISTSF
jgi:hypothetical protein